MTEREFSAGGLWWRVYGPGERTTDPLSPPPLVIFHGLFGSGDNWRSQATALAGDRAVLACDMPDHGRSDHWNTFEYRAVAGLLRDALAAALDEIGLPPETSVVLLGHSMGGKAAMAMALGAPGRCERLVVADIAPRCYPPRHEEIFAAMDAVASAGVRSRGEADRIMAEYVPQKPIRMFLLKSLVPTGDRGAAADAMPAAADARPAATPAGRYGWRLNLAGLRAGYEDIRCWPDLGTEDSYGGPTLFVAGGASPYVSDDDYPAINQLFPRARIHRIDRAGHWLHAEAKDQFVSVVRSFIS